MHTWEPVNSEKNQPINSETDRLAVPGGWVYRVQTQTYSNHSDGTYLSGTAVSVVFVPSAPESEEENS